MSEADDLRSGEPDYPTGVVDADIRTIAAAVGAEMLRPEPSLHRPRFSEGSARDIALGDVLTVSHVDARRIVLSHGDPVLETRPLDQQMDGVREMTGSLVVARLDDVDIVYGLSTPTDGWVDAS